jgi:orotidine-5'-phosphate decarboxylase
MTRQNLIEQIKNKRSFLCIGLDTDINKIPKFLLDFEDPIFEFNKRIIDATKHFCVAYKPNIAFYERHGAKGWESLAKTIAYLPENQFVIADAKRGDIGNTASYYADAFFKEMNCDAITVAPYMGKDSVTPFLNYENKWAIVLAMTSNPGSLDFQFNKDTEGKILSERVVEACSTWGTDKNMMFVVGATRSEDIARIRKAAPTHFFLVPGVGAQGGSLQDVVQYGWNADCGLLVNSSRGIIYASQEENFAELAALEAEKLQQEMAQILEIKGL